MAKGVIVDTSDFEAGLRDLLRQFSEDRILDDLELVAEEIIRRSIDSPIPRDESFLANSGAVRRDRGKKQVTFGFNRVYAAFQDQPGRTGSVTVRPRFKKWLFIPITDKARRNHRIGNNPRDEGLVFGGFVETAGAHRINRPGRTEPADYILAKKAIIPIKPYGSAVGPNHYFSETVRRNVDFSFEALRDLLTERIIQRFPEVSGGA